MAGGVGTLPLAPVTAVDRADVPAVIERLRDRIGHDASPARARELWQSTEILLGLRFDNEMARLLVKGVMAMQESTVYQDIRDRGRIEGRMEGRVEGERDLLVQIGTRKFGPPGPGVLARLAAVGDPAELGRLGGRMFDASTWDELLGG